MSWLLQIDSGVKMMKNRVDVVTKRWVALLGLALLVGGCAADDDAGAAAHDDGEGSNESNFNQDSMSDAGGVDQGDAGVPGDDVFEPEEEEFLVQEVAATDSYVFIPNQAEHSQTVAIIDGWEFSVHPVMVGMEPSQVVAADVDGQGSVGYVLSGSEPSLAVVRAEQGQGANRADVRMLTVPSEVNQLAIAPDGRHVLAYIDPDEPIDDSSSAASLQTMALIRLGEEPGEDEVYELSVTRFIEEIGFTDDGDQAFVVGEEGINRIVLDQIKSDAFIAEIDLELSDSPFPPQDQEVIFSSEGTTMVVRSSQYDGVGVFELDDEQPQIANSRLVDLAEAPTDVQLVERDDASMQVVATMRGAEQVALFEVDDALEAEEQDDSFVRTLDAGGVDGGIARLTPDEEALVLYSTLPEIPKVGLLELETETVRAYELRNQIRSLQISSDGRTAVVIHRPQDGFGSSGDPEEEFRHSEGMTLWDLDTGYRRPIGLRATPEEVVMVEDAQGAPLLYTMMEDASDSDQGVKRIELDTYRTDFFWLPRTPARLGAVGHQVFVSQEDETGRITFFDVDTKEQRTVSGYELNAGIE